ncbi:hypothetical protein FQN53_002172 [Emmonsiellopsis sp. PD_33]|nr:hypothetical protein FQN53_002172 [Emmonsiellopsis sp. PD_33]KAK2800738.1 hypothetical protein FQN51_005878 [Onygenales sp. PD_10]
MGKWTPQMDAMLLKGIIKKAKLSGKDHIELAEYMENRFTPKAIKEHIAALVKATPATEADISIPSTPTSSAKQTPQKRTPRTPKGDKASGSATASGKKRKSKISDDEDEGDEIPLGDGSPIKRVKPEQRDALKLKDNIGFPYW